MSFSIKKWCLLLAVSLFNLSFAQPIQQRRLEPAALSELAAAFNIAQDADLVAETQKYWLRKAGKERWELEELSTEKREFVLNWAEKQGLLLPWLPVDQAYDKALILGATTGCMKMRLDYLKKLWTQGTRFTEIVFLTGDRPLDPRIDGLTDRCKTESAAAKILWDESDLPEEMRKLPAVFIAVPMKVEGELLKRPNTEDTIIAWVEQEKKPCRSLFVSDQPFCGYQFAVIKKALPDSFLFDVVGDGVKSINHPAAAAVILDSVARWIYQENR